MVGVAVDADQQILEVGTFEGSRFEGWRETARVRRENKLGNRNVAESK